MFRKVAPGEQRQKRHGLFTYYLDFSETFVNDK